MKNLARYFVTAFLLLLPAGCGYSQDGYHWDSLYRSDIKTVAVPIFTTKDYRQGVEFQLSKALVTKIEEFTPYKVTSRDHADTIIEGEIVSIRPNTLSLNPYTATPQEEQYLIIVNFTWKDLRTGKVIVSRQNYEQTAVYYPTLGESEFVGSQTSVEKMAEGIVHEMEAAW